jgi:glycine cleavage system H protein
MSEIPQDLQYTKEHEWLRNDGDGIATIGITDHAQESLGDITYVELPETGDTFSPGDAFGVVESVKAASDLYMPVGGVIIETNAELLDSPEKVNESPYGNGWMVRVKLDPEGTSTGLLTPSAYTDIVGDNN